MKGLLGNLTYNKQTILALFCPKKGRSVSLALAWVSRSKRVRRATKGASGQPKELRFPYKHLDNQSGNRGNLKIYIEMKYCR